MTTTEATKPFDPATFEPEGRTVWSVLRDVNRYVMESGIEFGESSFCDMSRYGDRNLPQLRKDAAGDTLWPTPARWVLCTPVKGSNEGFYIHIATMEYVSDKGPLYRMLGSAKTWSWESALAIANAASTLFQQNLPYARFALVAPKPA
jgi:hypothetical protein